MRRGGVNPGAGYRGRSNADTLTGPVDNLVELLQRLQNQIRSIRSGESVRRCREYARSALHPYEAELHCAHCAYYADDDGGSNQHSPCPYWCGWFPYLANSETDNDHDRERGHRNGPEPHRGHSGADQNQHIPDTVRCWPLPKSYQERSGARNGERRANNRAFPVANAEIAFSEEKPQGYPYLQYHQQPGQWGPPCLSESFPHGSFLSVNPSPSAKGAYRTDDHRHLLGDTESETRIDGI